jgi:hypothetical protein
MPKTVARSSNRVRSGNRARARIAQLAKFEEFDFGPVLEVPDIVTTSPLQPQTAASAASKGV